MSDNDDSDDTPSPKDICGATTQDGTPCQRTAGWGTDSDTGRCSWHGGEGGAPDGNGNAQKHSLHADRDLLYQRLNEDRQQLVDEWEAALIERYREFHGREPDRADVEDLFEIAVGYAQRRIARAWLTENAEDEVGIMTEEVPMGEGANVQMVEVPSKMLSAINDNAREDRLRRKHKGLERDPATKQAEATASGADAIRDLMSAADDHEDE